MNINNNNIADNKPITKDTQYTLYYICSQEHNYNGSPYPFGSLETAMHEMDETLPFRKFLLYAIENGCKTFVDIPRLELRQAQQVLRSLNLPTTLEESEEVYKGRVGCVGTEADYVRVKEQMDERERLIKEMGKSEFIKFNQRRWAGDDV